MTETASSSSTPARERAAALLAPGSQLHGFTVERSEAVAELDADAYVLHHGPSGARLLYLACEDENKAFAIGFKTPPTDDTGVFHILEHSVLCGSAKFPVKEPFVDLIKSSMQTFLNAMTYPDKTVYPVATTNEQDLLNLMDVYMDAVLNPAIYSKKTIFEQEGWHLEVDEGEGAGEPGSLRYNGVVFNEMKGALSDPTDACSTTPSCARCSPTPRTALSPAATRVPSPRSPTSSSWTRTRATTTWPTATIVLYGDMDADRVLGFLDDRYLSDAAREAAAQVKREAGTLVENPGAPNVLELQGPVTCDYTSVEMNTTPEKRPGGHGVCGGPMRSIASACWRPTCCSRRCWAPTKRR